MPPRNRQFWIAVSVIGMSGAALLTVPAAVGLRRLPHDLMVAFGTALLVAAILAGTVDRWLKKRLVRDAFPELFGFMLTDEMKAELAWVYGQQVLVDQPHITLTLTPTEDSELLTARWESMADVRNVTSDKASWQPLIAVDEWFHEGRPSRVLSLRVTRGGTTHDEAESFGDGWMRGLRMPELSLEPEERVTVTSEAEETRHVSDAWFLNIVRPTAKPRVTVKVPDWIGYEVMFGNRGQDQVSQIGLSTYELPGTLLPGQVIQVRWWRKPPNEA